MRFAGLLVAIVVAPAVALAAPIATTKADVDGDGDADDIALEATEVVVTLGGGKRATFSLGQPIIGGTITTAQKPALIALQVQRAGGHEGIALRWNGSGLGQLWRGKIGPVGLDEEYRVELVATDAGLFRHESRFEYTRCDGERALLFADEWSDQKRAFVAATRKPSLIPATVAALRATPTTAPPPRSKAFIAKAASTSTGATHAGELARPSELDDGKLSTAWREDRAGAAIGDFFTYRARVKGARARALWIAPGAPGGAFVPSTRPSRIGVVGADRAYWIDIPDPPAAGTGYRVELPEPIADCVTIVIDAVHPGRTRAGFHTAIAEMVVLADLDLAPGGVEAALAAEVARGGPGAQGAADQLARSGPSGAAAAATALAASGLARDAKLRLLRIVIAVRSPATVGALVTAISDGDLRGVDLANATAALSSMGPAAVPALVAIAANTKQRDAARIAALAALGTTRAPAATGELVGLAGRGSRAIRVALIDALAKRGVAELIAAVATAQAASVGDVWRGIGKAAMHADTAARVQALTALRGLLAQARDYEQRYRAIQGVGALGDGAAIGEVEAMLHTLPPGAASSALHLVAANAVARNPDAAATRLLVRLIGHADPGVRRSAVDAVAQRDALTRGEYKPDARDDAAIDRAMIVVLAKDPWPELRGAVADALGTRCGRPNSQTARALDDVVDRDRDVGVRAEALRALVACNAPLIGDRLIAIASNDSAAMVLRERAVKLTVMLGDRKLIAPLLKLFERWRSAAFDSVDALVLAVRAADALGKLRAAEAARALASTLDDDALPELVAAAAAALGELGPACPRSAIPRLEELSRATHRTIRNAALRAVPRCGK